MGIKRIGKHLIEHHWRVRRVFPQVALDLIEQAIKAGEATHSGQVRFVVEGALDGMPLFKGQSARERALDIFSHLRIWDTAHNNGVLIYLLLADRDVEIVADRGIDAKVGSAGWDKICKAMEADFRGGNFSGGVIKGIRRGVATTGDVFPQTGRGSERTAGQADRDVGVRHSGALEGRTRNSCHRQLREERIPGSRQSAPRNDVVRARATPSWRRQAGPQGQP